MSTDERLARIERMIIMSSKNALNTKEVAIMLDISESRVRHLIMEKSIPYYKQGKKTYFKKSEIEDWMLHNRYETTAEIESKASTYIATGKF